MDRFSGVNSARRLNQVVDEWAKQRREAEAVVRERQKRSEELENAQMGSAEDIRKMLEMMEANQKEQAAEIQKKSQDNHYFHRGCCCIRCFWRGVVFRCAYSPVALSLISVRMSAALWKNAAAPCRQSTIISI